MENRHGFCVSFELTPSVGVTESQMALEQLKHLDAGGRAQPVALGQAEPGAAAGRGAGVSPRQPWCAQIQENA
jgi:hypothetical protein